MDVAPNPELLEEYGTDEIYLQNLEKAAADTFFGAPTAAISQAEWARLVTDSGQDQRRVDGQRMQASRINLQLRRLEGVRMGNTIENFGGAGTRRQQYTRALQTQPHMLHPLMLAGGLGGMGGGGMAGPGALAGMGMPIGTGAHMEEAGGDPTEGGLEALDAEMEVDASVKFAESMGRVLAQAELNKEAMTAEEVGGHYGQSAGSMGKAVRALGNAGGHAAVGTGKAIAGATGGVSKAVANSGVGKAVKSVGRGFKDWMNQDVQPQARYGGGFTPATDVNMYGVPIY